MDGYDCENDFYFYNGQTDYCPHDCDDGYNAVDDDPNYFVNDPDNEIIEWEFFELYDAKGLCHKASRKEIIKQEQECRRFLLSQFSWDMPLEAMEKRV